MRTVRYEGPGTDAQMERFVRALMSELHMTGIVKAILEPGDCTHYEGYIIYDNGGYTIVKVGETQVIMFPRGHNIRQHPLHSTMNLWTLYMWHTLVMMIDDMLNNHPFEMMGEGFLYDYRTGKLVEG
jgi:hypothetical protein